MAPPPHQLTCTGFFRTKATSSGVAFFTTCGALAPASDNLAARDALNKSGMAGGIAIKA